ncbi:MAG: FG-GAP repeat domain-containing protein [Cypionkella sp.]
MMRTIATFGACIALFGLSGAAPIFAQISGPAALTAADYGEPVRRYGHDVMGLGAEWGALTLQVERCSSCATKGPETRSFRLPSNMVFEDNAPRLIDLDHDGLPEVIVVESHMDRGARLAIWGPEGRIAAAPYIGASHRWLAIAGAADFDGDGAVEIAYVDRPHLNKVLRFFRYHNGRLAHVADQPGLTNHRFGEPVIQGGVRDCGEGPEVITADADWQQIMATQLENRRPVSRMIDPYSTVAIQAAMACK